MPIRIGTNKLQYLNYKSTIGARYTPPSPNNFLLALDMQRQKILIPQASDDFLRRIKASSAQCPELHGGPGKYLVVPENKISPDGNTCDKVGVSFRAFHGQVNRCLKPVNSCLHNQPLDFWKHDALLEKQGKKGCYFLKYFGKLPCNPIRYNPGVGNRTLFLYNEDNYTNTIDLEFKADFNTVLEPHSSAIISEIYSEGTNASFVSISVKVINSGLVAGIFYISFSDCQVNLPINFNKIASKMALIPPQNQHIFKIDIQCCLIREPVNCNVKVLNKKHELLAVRTVRIIKFDRCVCIWHCHCSCLIEDNGLRCKILSLKHYHSAGFQGGLPVATQYSEYTTADDAISMLLYLFLFLCVTLLIMGLTKAIIGWCCCVEIGLWGFDVLLYLPSKYDKQHYQKLRRASLLYTASGWPVPQCHEERIISVHPAAEFCLNVTFFFTYPLMLLIAVGRDFCCPTYTNECPPTDSSHSQSLCICGADGEECLALDCNEDGQDDELRSYKIYE